jgi:hypothetical protein
MPICWKDKADSNLRGIWGNGSRSTQKRARRTQRQLKLAASQSYSIADLFERQRLHQLGNMETGFADTDGEKDVPRACSPPPAPQKSFLSSSEDAQEALRTAVSKLDRLLRLPTEQQKNCGAVIDPRSSFHLRHRMVQCFLWLLLRRHHLQGRTQRELGYITANSFGRGLHTGKMIVKWAMSWVRHQNIPNTNAGRHKHNFSWMDDEDVIFAVRSFIREVGESKHIFPSTFQ